MEVKIFFNTHKKQGKEIGQSALDTIVKKAFIGSQYFDDVNFNPPEGFFDDKYIRGYLTNYVDLHITFVFNGKSWNTQKKGEFLLEAFNIIDPSRTLFNNHLQMSNDINIVLALRDDKDFKQGQEDSTTFVGTLYKKLRPDDPDPILAKARHLAPKLQEQNEFLSIGGGDHLPVAVYMLTFYEYVKNNWH